MMNPSRKAICLAVCVLLLLMVIPGTPGTEEKTPDRVLNIYNWEDYFGETTLKDFEKKSGVKVNLETFEDEEMMISNIQSHPGRYDVIVISGDSVRELAQMRLLAEIDLGSIPNLKQIAPEFRNPRYDPKHRYSVPYLWGTTGIALNRTFVKEKEPSWAILWNPAYRGKIAMLNNLDEVIGAALKYLGYSINTINPDRIEAARRKLLDQEPLLSGYLDPIAIRKKLISGELWAAQIYSGEGMYAADKNEAVEYIIPGEGSSRWIDCLAIPRDAGHKAEAFEFINYILEPEVSAAIANHLWYANCNRGARAYTDKEILESPSLYPPPSVLKNCEFFHQTGTADQRRASQQKYNRIWSELRLKKSSPPDTDDDS